jgi:hypothetical protein
MDADHEPLGPACDGSGSSRFPISDSWNHIRTVALVVTFIAIVYAVAAVGYYSGLIEGLRALPVTTESEL